MKVQALAARAANDYRGRDIVTYLALRYYLLAHSARNDRWAREIATSITFHRSSVPYREFEVYKGLQERSSGHEPVIDYRKVHYPAPTEALAEAALLSELARVGGPFSRHECVFSNVLSAYGTAGSVEPYFSWWAKRQKAIEASCRQNLSATVVYLDLQKFYPSVSSELASAAWKDAAASVQLGQHWVTLGDKLLADYSTILGGRSGLLSGPVFGHVVGNIVLQGLDDTLLTNYPGRCFRYVDDIALVIPFSDIKSAKTLLKDALPEGLHINEAKTLEMGAKEWISITSSFESEMDTLSWGRFVSGLKFFLFAHKGSLELLQPAALAEGFRLPLRDNKTAAQEQTTVQRFIQRIRAPWFDREKAPTKVSDVLRLAREAREKMTRAFNEASEAVSGIPSNQKMRRKLQIQKLRYAAKRLLFLAPQDQLGHLARMIEDVPEISELHAIFVALSSRDVTNLLAYSSSVAQAAAQVLLADGGKFRCSSTRWINAQEDAWSVLRMNGVPLIDAGLERIQDSPMVRFAARRPYNPHELQQLTDYYRELHAVCDIRQVDHQELLATAINGADPITFDALHLLGLSS